MRLLYLISFIILWSFLVLSCGPTYHLAEDKKILRAVHLNIDGPLNYQEKNKIKSDLSYIYPNQPNSYIFNAVPYKSFLYNLRYKKYQKDSFNFQIINGIVEPPSIYEATKWDEIPTLMETYFKNQGYFDAHVHKGVKEKKKKVNLSFDIHTGTPYIISAHKWGHFPEELSYLKEEIEQASLLNMGTYYHHGLLEEERKTLLNTLRNKGYYNLHLNDIRFELDTINAPIIQSTLLPLNDYLTQLGRKDPTFKFIQIFTFLTDSKNQEPTPKALTVYKIKEVNIFANYAGYGVPSKEDYKHLMFHDHHYYFTEEYINTNVIDRHLFLRKGQIFSEKNYAQTLRQLSDLGVFKYSAIHIHETGDDELGIDIYLEPFEKYDFNTTLELSGGDLYTVGSVLQLSLINKNLFKGANRLSSTISYGLELEHQKTLSEQILEQFYLYSQNLGINFKLDFPKFLLPIDPSRFSRNHLPFTSIHLGGNYMERFKYFKLFNVSSSLQYQWKETPRTSWVISPIYLNSLHLKSIDPSFQLRMDSIPAIKNAYQETFIHGERVEIQHVFNNKKHTFMTKVGIEEAGLISSSLLELMKAQESKVAQFIRLDWETKWMRHFTNSQTIIRFTGGIGKPYGNSTVLPYIKQFYVGGPYSIRGWLPRYLGPGSYNIEKHQSNIDHLFMDQAGDIKLELNLEYRFPIISLFKGSIRMNGATFLDAGNIWLYHKDTMLPGAQFKFSELAQDLAISTGVGLRFDLSNLFIIRFDWGLPIKKPYISENFGWTVSEIDFKSREWRRNNLNMNIAIGYPF